MRDPSPAPFLAIAALALCAVVATKVIAEGGFRFPGARNGEACRAGASACDAKRCRVAAPNRNPEERSPTCS